MNNRIASIDVLRGITIFLMILSEKEVDNNGVKTKVPDLILTQVLGKEPGKEGHTKIVKQWQKNGLYDALDIGTVTLDRLNSEK